MNTKSEYTQMTTHEYKQRKQRGIQTKENKGTHT